MVVVFVCGLLCSCWRHGGDGGGCASRLWSFVVVVVAHSGVHVVLL